MQEARQALEVELRREVSQGHTLYSVPAEAIARRIDCDDVLFALTNSPAVALVHLSYRSETSADWPHAKVFGSRDEWLAHALKEDR